MREKTTLLELARSARPRGGVVGVDGGTLHLAGTTDVPIVFASGTTLPEAPLHPAPRRPEFRVRYVGPRDLECYGCQSNWPLTTCTSPNACTATTSAWSKLHPDDFINGLKELGL
jgi:hypothetical protein